jgi:hypothetical protein
MIATLAAVTVALASFSPRTDTTVTVPAQARIVIENFAGEVTVATWTKNAVRIEADHSSRTTVDIEREGSTLAIKPRGKWGTPSSCDFRITAPAAAGFEISGVYTDVSIAGTRGEVAVETVKGDVFVKGGSGRLSLQSVEGDVSLEGATGNAELSSVNASVTVTGYEGTLQVETVNGEIVLEGIRGPTVEASTVNGEVIYDGEVRAGGHYMFATHNGDITVGLPESPNVTVAVSTFGGDFETSFPIKLKSSERHKRMRFTLGTGAAELELESFQGTIRLVERGASGMGRAKEKIKSEKERKRIEREMEREMERKQESGEGGY